MVAATPPGPENGSATSARRKLGGNLRKFVDPEAVAFREHHRPEHGVFELPDIAGPMMGDQEPSAVRRQVRMGFPSSAANSARKWRASAAMSPGRSRSGGTVIGNTCSR